MNLDPFKQAWQSQTSQPRLTIDAELLLNEVRRNERNFTATIFWRDVREVGTAMVLVPVWIFLGMKLHLPWTWYLTVPVLLWIAGFMLIDRMRHKPEQAESTEPLRGRVKSSRAQIEHQIWLLRNVFWWYLLPLGLSIMAFVGDVTWRRREGGWWTVLAMACLIGIFVLVFVSVYRLNQHAVREELEPRLRELEELERILFSLRDETPTAT